MTRMHPADIAELHRATKAIERLRARLEQADGKAAV